MMVHWTVRLLGLFALLVGISLLGAGSVNASHVTVFTAGINDNFALPTEPTSPSADFRATFSTAVNFKDFDDTRNDRVVAHTFKNLPACIVSATLETQLRAGSSFLSHNDGLNLTFVGEDQIVPPIGSERWSRRIGTGHNVPGVLPFDWHSPAIGQTIATILLDLANLPLAPGQPSSASNLIPALNQHGFLDFYIQDDTDVDFIALTVTTDCPIDIKPRSDPNSINTNSKGTIPVAILSTGDFDAPNQVDKTSLTFGRTGDEQSLAKCTKGAEDVNNDGLLDLVCHFKTRGAGFQMGDTEGILKGETVDGRTIEGSDSVRIVR